MAGDKTIEIISRHTGKVNVTVKGEPTTILFKEVRDGVGVAMVDHDEAEALLKPGLKDDFWKEGVIEVEKQTGGQGGKQTGGAQPKAADLIEKIQAATTEEEVNTILGEDKRPTVVSAAQVRIEEIKEAAEKKD